MLYEDGSSSQTSAYSPLSAYYQLANPLDSTDIVTPNLNYSSLQGAINSEVNLIPLNESNSTPPTKSRLST